MKSLGKNGIFTPFAFSRGIWCLQLLRQKKLVVCQKEVKFSTEPTLSANNGVFCCFLSLRLAAWLDYHDTHDSVKCNIVHPAWFTAYASSCCWRLWAGIVTWQAGNRNFFFLCLMNLHYRGLPGKSHKDGQGKRAKSGIWKCQRTRHLDYITWYLLHTWNKSIVIVLSGWASVATAEQKFLYYK